MLFLLVLLVLCGFFVFFCLSILFYADYRNAQQRKYMDWLYRRLENSPLSLRSRYFFCHLQQLFCYFVFSHIFITIIFQKNLKLKF